MKYLKESSKYHKPNLPKKLGWKPVFISLNELTKISNLAGDVVLDAKKELLELGLRYENKIPMKRVNDILQKYNLEMDEFNEWENKKESKNEDFENMQPEYEIGDTLTYKEMVNYILDNNLKSVGGDIDYNEARDIASRSSAWELKMVNLDNFDWVSDSDYENSSIEAYPIIVYSDDDNDDIEVLDGKHRIGMLNDKDYIEYPMWVSKNK